MTRRGLLALLFLGTPKYVSATGFHVTGLLSATEQERQEGYATIGNDLMIATHPKSPIYQNLIGMVGSTVRISVVPTIDPA